MAGLRKVVNFGAGPAKIPEQVLVEVQRDLINHDNTNLSVMEMSHRSSTYLKINADAQQAIRDLLLVPDNYQVLFLQGGGTGLFAAVCLNLLPQSGEGAAADYIVTGSWSQKAAQEAAKYCRVNHVLPKAGGEAQTSIPDQDTWTLDPEAAYVYYCANETIHGIEFPFVPETNGVPLVCDMSSNILSRPVDVSKFAVIFAGAQKNIGPAGVTVVIVRDDCLGKALPICPTVFNFAVMAKDKSVHNTPPTFNIYVMGKVFEWISKNGGVPNMEKRAITKSNLIYDVIKNSRGFYSCPVAHNAQSRMNIPFRIGQKENRDELEKKIPR